MIPRRQKTWKQNDESRLIFVLVLPLAKSDRFVEGRLGLQPQGGMAQAIWNALGGPMRAVRSRAPAAPSS